MKNVNGWNSISHRHCEPCFSGRGNLMLFKNEIASTCCPASGGTRSSRPRNDKLGFTLIEVVMIILITSVLSMAGYHLMQLVVRNSFFLPNQVQADLVAADALEIIVEGDGQAKGLRFCRNVSNATATQVVVTNQGVLSTLDPQTITYDLTSGVLSRTIRNFDGSTTTSDIPDFMAGDMVISGTGRSNALFTYFDKSDMELTQPILPANLPNIRRINIDLKAQNGTGSSDKYEGTSQQSTSIKVSRYQ